MPQQWEWLPLRADGVAFCWACNKVLRRKMPLITVKWPSISEQKFKFQQWFKVYIQLLSPFGLKQQTHIINLKADSLRCAYYPWHFQALKTSLTSCTPIQSIKLSMILTIQGQRGALKDLNKCHIFIWFISYILAHSIFSPVSLSQKLYYCSVANKGMNFSYPEINLPVSIAKAHPFPYTREKPIS